MGSPYVCIYVSMKYWWILIWRLHRQTVKLPNLIPYQIFRLYGITHKVVIVRYLAFNKGCHMHTNIVLLMGIKCKCNWNV